MSIVFGNSNGAIWGLVQRALRDAGFKAAPVHVAILDKGQRTVKGLSSGTEGKLTNKDGAHPSHVYARILQEAIKKHYVLDRLHLGDVLVALCQAGFMIDAKIGLVERKDPSSPKRKLAANE